MKRLLLILILPLLFLECKKNDLETEPAVKSIAGKWQLVAYEKTVDGEKVWENVDPDSQKNFTIFRGDGVILDSKGLPACCAPMKYFLNGNLFEIKTVVDHTLNSSCNFVDCIGCEYWNIEQKEDEMIITLCDTVPIKTKYIRVN